MLPHAAGGTDTTRLFGTYNTVATLAGSLGALAAFFAASRLWLLAYPIAARVRARRCRAAVCDGRDRPRARHRATSAAPRSKGIVMRLSALFALDSFGGGFVVQSFIAYWFALKFGTSHQTLAIVFLAIGFIQARVVPDRRAAVAADRPAADDGVHAPALEHPARGDRVRADVRRRGRAPARPLRAQPDGRSCAPGVRRGRRRSDGADGRRGVHEHRALRDAAGRAAARRCSAHDRARCAVRHRGRRSRASTTSASTRCSGASRSTDELWYS